MAFFQNLKKEDKTNHWFWFRGNRSWVRYEFCSGPALRFTFTIGPAPKISLTIGALFFTAYLTLPFFSFPKLKEELETGFYVYHWAIVWDWMKEKWESKSGQPWWKSFYFHIDDFFLGKSEQLKNELCSIEDVYFKLGGKEFKMDRIEWIRYRHFRRYIPYVLYHKTYHCVDMKINKPPQRSGKGENSWDCGDDGTYGMHAGWDHLVPSYLNRGVAAELAVEQYVKSVLKDAARYGGSSSERGINKSSVFEYIGVRRENDGRDGTAEANAAQPAR